MKNPLVGQEKHLTIVRKKILIDACSGVRNFANSDYLDAVPQGGFSDSMISMVARSKQKQQPTFQTLASFYRVSCSATYLDMYNSFGVWYDKLAFTQHQIISMCDSNKRFIRDHAGYCTLFLFKNNNQFLISQIFCDEKTIRTRIDHLWSGYVWDSKYRLHIFAPMM